MYQHLESVFQSKVKRKLLFYFLVIFLSFLVGIMIIGIIARIFPTSMSLVGNQPHPSIFSPSSEHLLGFSLSFFSFVIFLFLQIALAKKLLNTSWQQICNGTKNIRCKRIMWGVILFLLWLPILIFFDPSFDLDALLFNPNFSWDWFIIYSLVCLVLIFFQAGMEEFTFRGLLPQTFYILFQKKWLILLCSATIFALLHLQNPEVEAYGLWQMAATYFLGGIFFGLIAILDDGIELAIGIHFINNFIQVILLSNVHSVIYLPSTPFYIETFHVDYIFLSTLITYVPLVFIMSWLFKWDFSVLWKQKKLSY